MKWEIGDIASYPDWEYRITKIDRLHDGTYLFQLTSTKTPGGRELGQIYNGISECTINHSKRIPRGEDGPLTEIEWV